MLGATLLSLVMVGQTWGEPSAPEITVNLVSSHFSVMPGDRFAVLVEMDISDPWHVYWKNPGDSGIPTRVEWDLPEGWKASKLEFPAPHRLTAGDLISYGFEHKLTLLSWVTVPSNTKPGREFKIGAQVNWLACVEQCIPGDADVSAMVRVAHAPKANNLGMTALTGFRRGAPKSPGDGLINVWRKGDGYSLVLNDAEATSIFFFADSYDVVSPGADQLSTKQDGYVEVNLVKSPYSEELAMRLKGVLTYIDKNGDQQAYAVNVPVRLPTRDGENK